MKTQFPFSVRMATQVAMAIEEEVGTCRPVLLSLSGEGEKTTLRFEGGTVVTIHLIELSQFDESWRQSAFQEWVVTHADVRFRPTDGAEKITETWDATRLRALKEARPWWHPRVVGREEILGLVGVFLDHGSGTGFISVDPETNNQDRAVLVDEAPYRRFVDGDLDRAKKEAARRLDLLKNGPETFFEKAVAEVCAEHTFRRSRDWLASPGFPTNRAHLLFVLQAALAAGKAADFQHLGDAEEVLGKEQLTRLVNKACDELREKEGWRTGIELDPANHFTFVLRPSGKKTIGVTLGQWPEVEAAFLDLADAMSADEKAEMREDLGRSMHNWSGNL